MAGKSSVSSSRSSRDRVGMRRVRVRARHTSPDKETSTQRGNKHSTRKHALNEETSTRRGNKHSTRETCTQQGNEHSTRKQALISRYFHNFLLLHMLDPLFSLCQICSNCGSMMYYTHVHIYFPNSPRNQCTDCNHIQKWPNINSYHLPLTNTRPLSRRV